MRRLQVARGGRDTLVIDKEAAGFGCSTRNGGQVGSSIKPGFGELAKRHGETKALAILQEGHRSLAWLGEFIAAEKIDCDYRVSGRFHAAHSPRQYEALVRAVENTPPGIDHVAELVPRAEQAREIGGNAYHGGVVYTRHAAVDPARYHRGLLERVLDAGATDRPALRRGGDQRRAGRFPREDVARDRRGPRRHRRHEWLYRRCDAVAEAAGDPDRQLHHRDRADRARK